MDTSILDIDANSLALAAKLISGGDIVAFPTETVYGLGANAFDECAVKKIYQAKGRPSDNPLIVHIADKALIEKICLKVSDDAKKVMDSLMPGPITIVLEKNGKIPDCVTGGLNTVAVRMPSSPEAQAFLKACNLPVCAPSANTSTRPSPTTWKHVAEDMEGKIPLILKGADCQVGIESTVLDLTRETPLILRPGIVTQSEIEKVLGKKVGIPDKFDKSMNSPGIRYKHYAPKCDTYLNTDGDREKIKNFALSLEKNVGIVASDAYEKSFEGFKFFSLGNTVEDGAHNIFKKLRDAEKQCDAIIIIWDVKSEKADSVFNRVIKSCGGKTF